MNTLNTNLNIVFFNKIGLCIILFVITNLQLLSQNTYVKFNGTYTNNDSFAKKRTTLTIFDNGFYSKTTVTGRIGSGMLYYEFGYSISKVNSVYFHPISKMSSDRNVGIQTHYLDYRSLNSKPTACTVNQDTLVNRDEYETHQKLEKLSNNSLELFTNTGIITGIYIKDTAAKSDDTYMISKNIIWNKKYKDSSYFRSYYKLPFKYMALGQTVDSLFKRKQLIIRNKIENNINNYVHKNDNSLNQEPNGSLIGVFDVSKNKIVIHQNNLFTDIKKLEEILKNAIPNYEHELFPLEIRRIDKHKIEIRK